MEDVPPQVADVLLISRFWLISVLYNLEPDSQKKIKNKDKSGVYTTLE